MNREIKFRAWDYEHKEMIYPEDAIKEGGFVTNYGLLQEKYRDGPKFWVEGEREIMQYTGLKDVNGKDIYEGDIVQMIGTDIRMPVTFENGCFRTPYPGSNYRLWNWKPGSLKVIGNIYANPDLLPSNNTQTPE